MKLLDCFAKKHYVDSPLQTGLATECCGMSSTAPSVGLCILVECVAAAYCWLFLTPVVCRLSKEEDEEHHVLQDMVSYNRQ